ASRFSNTVRRVRRKQVRRIRRRLSRHGSRTFRSLPKNGTCAVRRATIESHYPLRKYFLRVRSSLFRRAPTRSSSINRSTTSPLFHRYSSARSNLYRTYFSPFLLQN